MVTRMVSLSIVTNSLMLQGGCVPYSKTDNCLFLFYLIKFNFFNF